jgi:hypothetical protein
MSFFSELELERRLLGTIRDWVSEGLGLLKRERSYAEIEDCIKYVEGKQYPLRSRTISQITDNRVKKIVLETISALTDVRPIWNYDTSNEDYAPQGEILNKLARGWWKNGYVDRKLQSTLTFSCVGGSGYAALTWNEDLPGGGDLQLVPYDPRDVIPIDPVYSDSLQDWRGVILRQRLPVTAVRAMYPSKAHRISGRAGSWFGTIQKEGASMFSVTSAVWNVLTRDSDKQSEGPEYVDLLRVFVKDDSLHTGQSVMLMGEPDSTWEYEVYPLGSTDPRTGNVVGEKEARLYPRGRMIVCTPDVILEDGPNPYWHGMLPVIRFTLDPLPWSLLGASMVADLIPMQNALNEVLRGMEDGIGQWVRRGVVADKSAISAENLKQLDTRKNGLKAHLNPGAGKGFEILDGPVFPEWLIQLPEFIKGEMDENSGVRALQQLAQMKQLPSSDAMEKYMDALSPMLRLRARSIEVSLSELAEMVKVGFFQFYDATRRLQVLGPDGLSLEDFDYDPGNLVPESLPGGSRIDRAERHHRNFTFSIAPNSFLNVSHSLQKMMNLQLIRANLLDPWSAWESFDMANIGKAPADTIPERIIEARRLGLLPGPTPEMVQAQQAMTIVQAQMAMAQMGMQQNAGLMQPPGGGGGPGGPPPEGAPTTGTTSQGGRPPSGQQTPQFVMKDGGSRMTVSESGT